MGLNRFLTKRMIVVGTGLVFAILAAAGIVVSPELRELIVELLLAIMEALKGGAIEATQVLAWFSIS